MSRAAEYLSSIPVVTCSLLAVNIIVHVAIFLTSASLNKFMMNYHLVVSEGEYFRIVSAAFVHGGIMHILMNMSSLIQLGPSLEIQFGSLKFLFLSLWSVILIGLLYCGLSWWVIRILVLCRNLHWSLWAISLFFFLFIPYIIPLNSPHFHILRLSFETIDKTALGQSAVGYSGVLFCYAVIEANHTVESTRSVFGLFDVPAKLMPFVLLVLIQVRYTTNFTSVLFFCACPQ